MERLEVIVSATTAQFQQGMRAATRSLDDFSTKAERAGTRAATGLEKAGRAAEAMGRQLTTVSATAAGVGGAAVKVASDYERSFSRITGLVGVASDEVDRMRDATLELAVAAGRGPQELAEGMFVVTSAGLRGADAMDALELAAKGAAAGMGETRDIARTVAAATNAYGTEVLSVSRANDVLVATARAGNFEVSGLSRSLGRVLPIAASAGVAMEDLGGGIALLTRGGLSASEAVTQMRGILNSLVSPTEQVRNALADAGLTIEQVRQVAAGPEGLVGALRLMWEASGQSQDAFAKMVGPMESVGAALTIVNADAATISATFGEVANSTGVLNDAFNAAADTAGFKMQQATAAIQTALISLGDTLLPVAASVATFVADVAQGFASLPAPVLEVAGAFTGLAAVAAPTLIAFGKVAQVSAVVVRSMTAMSTATVGWNAVAASATVGATALGVALAAVAAAGAVYLTWAAHTRDRTEQVATSQQNFDAVLRQVPGSAAEAAAFVRQYAAELDDVRGRSDEASTATSEMATAFRAGLSTDTLATLDKYGISLEDLANGAGASAEELRAAANGAGLFTGSFNPLAPLLTDLVVGVEGFAAGIREDLQPAAGSAVDGILRLGEAGVISRAELESMLDELANVALGMEEASATTFESADSFVALQGGLAGVSDGMARQALDLGRYRLGLDETNASLEEQLDAVAQSGRAMEFLGEVVLKASDQWKTASDDTKAFALELATAEDGTLNAATAMKVLEGDIKAVDGGFAGAMIVTGNYSQAVEEAANSTEIFGQKINDLDISAVAEETGLAEDAVRGLANVFQTELNDLDTRQAVAELEALRELADQEIELGADTAEVEEAFQRAAETVTELTEEDWELIISGDSSGFEEETARVILMRAGLEEDTIDILINGDAAQLELAVIAAANDLGIIDESVATAALDADATGLFNTLDAGLAALRAFDVAMQAAQLKLQTLASASQAIAPDANLEADVIRSFNAASAAARTAGIDFGSAQSALDGYRSAAESSSEASSTLGKSVGGAGRAASTAAGETDELADAQQTAEEAAEAHAEELDRLADVADGWVDAAGEIAAVNQEVAESFDDVGSSIGDAVSDFEALTGLDDTLLDAQIAAAEAMRELVEGFGDEEFSATLDFNTEGGAANLDAFREARDAGLELAASVVATTGELGQGIAEWDRYRQSLIDAGVEAGFTAAEIEELLPDDAAVRSVLIDVELESEEARAELQERTAELAEWDGRTVTGKLTVDAVEARRELAETALEAGQIDGKTFLANLDADPSDAEVGIAATILSLDGYSSEEAVALLDADPAEAQVKIAALLLDLGLISKAEAKAIFRADSNPFDTRFADVRARLVELNGDKAEVILELASDQFDTGVFEAALAINELTGQEALVKLAADKQPFDEATAEALLTAAGFSEKRATKILEGDPTRLNNTLIAVGLAVGAFTEQDVLIAIGAEDETDPTFQAIEARAKTISDRGATVTIDADGNAVEVIDEVDGELNEVDDREANASVGITRKNKNELRRFQRRLTEIGETDVAAKVAVAMRGESTDDLRALATDLRDIGQIDAAARITAFIAGKDDLDGLQRALDLVEEGDKTVNVDANVTGGDDIGEMYEAIGEVAGDHTVDVVATVDGGDKVDELDESVEELEGEHNVSLAATVTGAEEVETLDETVAELTDPATPHEVTVDADTEPATTKLTELDTAVTAVLSDEDGTARDLAVELRTDELTPQLEALGLAIDAILTDEDGTARDLAFELKTEELMPQLELLDLAIKAILEDEDGTPRDLTFEPKWEEELNPKLEELGLLIDSILLDEDETPRDLTFEPKWEEELLPKLEELDLAITEILEDEDGTARDLNFEAKWEEELLPKLEELDTLITEILGEEEPRELTFDTTQLEELRTAVEELGQLLDEVLEERELTIESNIPDVTAEAEELRDAADDAAEARDLQISSNIPEVTGQANELNDAANTAAEARNLVITATLPLGEVNAFAAAADAAAAPRTATITVVTSGADAAKAQIDAAAANRTATISVTQQINVNTTETLTRVVNEVSQNATGAVITSAKGNVVDFGSATLTSPKRAFIAAPNSAVRVMNEAQANRTGEAFIPLASPGSPQHPRSMSIFRETGRRLGVDPALMAFANGGIAGALSAPAPMSGNMSPVTTINVGGNSIELSTGIDGERAASIAEGVLDRFQTELREELENA